MRSVITRGTEKLPFLLEAIPTEGESSSFLADREITAP